MYATIPVYYPSLEQASRNDESAFWCDSYNINMDCRNFIQDRAATALNTIELDSLIEDLVNHYGIERAMYVLSRTVQFSKWDERFTAVVKEKADTFPFPDSAKEYDENHVDPTSRYIVRLNRHMINAIYAGLIKREERQKELESPEPIAPDENDQDRELEI